MALDAALSMAAGLGLDLVEISPESRPPVCRIMDHGKFKYEQKKRTTEAKKHQVQTTVKEIKFRPKIEEHDYKVKVDNIMRFLGEGHKAKVTMMFRGREITRPDTARKIMERIVKDLRTYGTVEQLPKLEGRNMIMVVAPSKEKKATGESHGSNQM